MIRDIDQIKWVAPKCVCIYGGHVKDIHRAVDRLSDDRKLRHIILTVGGNDCDNGKDKLVMDIVAEYKDLIESSKTIASSVTVANVCPRRKSPEITERIVALNAGLQVLCSDLQVDYVDNNPAFYLQNGSFSDGFLLPDKSISPKQQRIYRYQFEIGAAPRPHVRSFWPLKERARIRWHQWWAWLFRRWGQWPWCRSSLLAKGRPEVPTSKPEELWW